MGSEGKATDSILVAKSPLESFFMVVDLDAKPGTYNKLKAYLFAGMSQKEEPLNLEFRDIPL